MRRQSGVTYSNVDFQRYTLPSKKYQFCFLRCGFGLSPLSSSHDFVLIITWLTFLVASSPIPSHSYRRNVIGISNKMCTIRHLNTKNVIIVYVPLVAPLNCPGTKDLFATPNSFFLFPRFLHGHSRVG